MKNFEEFSAALTAFGETIAEIARMITKWIKEIANLIRVWLPMANSRIWYLATKHKSPRVRKKNIKRIICHLRKQGMEI